MLSLVWQIAIDYLLLTCVVALSKKAQYLIHLVAYALIVLARYIPISSQGQVGSGWVGTLVEELIDDGISGMDALFVKCGYIWNYNKLAIYNNIVLCISKL